MNGFVFYSASVADTSATSTDELYTEKINKHTDRLNRKIENIKRAKCGRMRRRRRMVDMGRIYASHGILK